MKSLYPDRDIPDDVSISTFILDKILPFEDKTAWIDAATGRRITFREYGLFVTSLALELRQQGVGVGDVVMTMNPNCIEHPILLLAVISLGAIITPINSQSKLVEVIHRLEDADVSYVFTTQQLLPLIKEAINNTGNVKKVFTFDVNDGGSSNNGADCSFWGLVDEGKHLLQNDTSQSQADRTFNAKDTTALLAYSSGTTGRPKGVILTHYNVIALIIQISYSEISYGYAPDTITLGYRHLSSICGLVLMQLFCPCIGNTLVMMHEYNFKKMLQCIQEYRVTFMVVTPADAMPFLKSPLVSEFDLGSLRAMVCGGAPLGLATTQALKQKLNIQFAQGYGLTETCAVATRPPRTGYKKGSVGVLIPNMELKIMDLTSSSELGAGEVGEMWLRGPNITTSYLNAPQATADTLVNGGWLITGDLAYYDQHGAVYIIDRIKELIKYRGYQVAPAVLEDLLQLHDSIEDAVVVGVADEMDGELPRAYVVIKPGKQLEVDDIHKIVEDALSPQYKLRGGVEFVTSIPKSANGKIQRRELRAIVQRE